jgi:hypothetical protein
MNTGASCGRMPRDVPERPGAMDYPDIPNAASGLALRKLEHLVLLQQGIHGFPKQILLSPTVFFRELVQQ